MYDIWRCISRMDAHMDTQEVDVSGLCIERHGEKRQEHKSITYRSRRLAA